MGRRNAKRKSFPVRPSEHTFLSLAHMKLPEELGEILVPKSSQTQVSVAGWFLKVQGNAKGSPVVNHQDS